MYAVVKKIDVGTMASSGGRKDKFVSKMQETIGKSMQFEKCKENGWYKNNTGTSWYYHESWLKLEKKKAK